MDTRSIDDRTARCLTYFDGLPGLAEDESKLRIWRGYFMEAAVDQVDQSELQLIYTLLDQVLSALVNVSIACSLEGVDVKPSLGLGDGRSGPDEENLCPLDFDQSDGEDNEGGHSDSESGEYDNSDDDDSLWGSPDHSDDIAGHKKLISENIRQLLRLCQLPRNVVDDATTWPVSNALVIPDALLEALQAQETGEVIARLESVAAIGEFYADSRETYSAGVDTAMATGSVEKLRKTLQAKEAGVDEYPNSVAQLEKNHPTTREGHSGLFALSTELDEVMTQQPQINKISHETLLSQPEKRSHVSFAEEYSERDLVVDDDFDTVLYLLGGINNKFMTCRFLPDGGGRPGEDNTFATLQLNIVWFTLCRWAPILFWSPSPFAQSEDRSWVRPAIPLLEGILTTITSLESRAVRPQGRIMEDTAALYASSNIAAYCAKEAWDLVLRSGNSIPLLTDETGIQDLLVERATLNYAIRCLCRVVRDLWELLPLEEDRQSRLASRILNLHSILHPSEDEKELQFLDLMKRASQGVDAYLYRLFLARTVFLEQVQGARTTTSSTVPLMVPGLQPASNPSKATVMERLLSRGSAGQTLSERVRLAYDDMKATKASLYAPHEALDEFLSSGSLKKLRAARTRSSGRPSTVTVIRPRSPQWGSYPSLGTAIKDILAFTLNSGLFGGSTKVQ